MTPEEYKSQHATLCANVAAKGAEIERLRSVMQQTEDAMNRACMRDGGSYWLPAPGHQVETWSGNLNTALELGAVQQQPPEKK